MSAFGTTAAQSIAGTSQAERTQARETEKSEPKRRPQPRRGIRDEVDVHSEETEMVDPVRSLKDNSDEEAQDDHTEHPHYDPDGKLRGGTKRKKLDLQG